MSGALCGGHVWQPLTRHELLPRLGDEPFIATFDPDELHRCHVCNDERPARDLVIRVDITADLFEVRCADECYTGARRERVKQSLTTAGGGKQ